MSSGVVDSTGENCLIHKILGEMKSQFNRVEEHATEVEGSSPDSSSNAESELTVSTKVEEIEAPKEENEDKQRIVLTFKKPIKEALKKDMSKKSKKVNDKNDINLVKRSTRRRSKDCTESVLQSAIARKEKSYNESSKPQRLTRQLKPTQKILENLANAKQDKKFKQKINESIESEEQKRTLKQSLRLPHLKKPPKRFKGSDDSSDSSNEENGRKKLAYEIPDLKQELEESVITPNEDFEPETSPNEAKLEVSRLCFCLQPTKIYSSGNETMFCSAIDSVDDKLVGCTKQVKSFMMLRASVRVPYGILCETHQNRLLRHNCCPSCGVFCTQGKFIQCPSKHQYHKKCSIRRDISGCPHCGSDVAQEVTITMSCSKKPVFLTSRQVLYVPAKTEPTSQTETPMEQFEIEDMLLAIQESNIEMAVSILNANVIDVNQKLYGQELSTLLHYAVQKSNLPMVHILVSSGCELDAFDQEQNTPLAIAIQEEKNDVVRYLIKAGSTITLKGTDGMTCLHVAAKYGNLEACQILLESEGTGNDFVNVRDDGGWSPLVWACEHSHIEVANYLLSQKADPLLRDVEQNISLHWAAFSGNPKIVEMLLDYGCDVNTANAHGDTPMHIAAREDMSQCVLLLLSRGADTNAINKNSETPLDCAPETGDCIKILSENINELASTYKATKAILTNDISNGREANPIQCVNYIDDEPKPTDFVYITKSWLNSENVVIDTRINSIRTCTCTDRCGDSCECNAFCYDEQGRLNSDFNFNDPQIIIECNELCSCNAITCLNRTVQKGLNYRFELFKTENKGWAVKALNPIPKGSFVCEYVGEILSDEDADRRDDDSFFFDLDNKENECYCLDSKFYGNFTRFINHSCEPNLSPVKVFVEHQDMKFPRVAFFACKDINAEEELCFDYGEKFWLVKYKSITCQCGMASCKYNDIKDIDFNE